MWNWFVDSVSWMYWNTPSVIGFSLLFITLIGMTVWEIKSPTILRKGFLPIATTRGDRLFIGILSTILIFLIWLAFAGDKLIWIPLCVSAVWFFSESMWG